MTVPWIDQKVIGKAKYFGQTDGQTDRFQTLFPNLTVDYEKPGGQNTSGKI